MLYCQFLAHRLRIRQLSLKPVPPMFRLWYEIDIHDPILSIPHPSSQHSSTPPVANPADEVGEMPVVVGNRSEDGILPSSDPSSQQPASDPEPNTSDKLKKAWGVTWTALETALRLLEKSADAFPPLKSAVGGLVACLDLAQVGYGYGLNVLCLI